MKKNKKTPPKAPLNPAWVPVIFLGLALVWALVGTWYHRAFPSASSKTSGVKFTVQAVKSIAQERDLLVQFVGQTEASRLVTLRAQTAGQVTMVSSLKGKFVSSGDMVVRLDPADRPQRLAKAQARLAQREQEYRTATTLSQKGFESKTGLTRVTADLKEAQAAAAEIAQDLAYTTIAAPFSGMLDQRLVNVGDVVAIGTPVAVVADLDPIRITGYVPETQVSLLKLGQGARVTLTTGQVLEGMITYQSTVANEKTHMFQLELDIPNPQQVVVSGITAQVVIPVQRVKGHFVAPSILSLTDKGDLGIKTVDDKGIVHFYPIRVLSTEPQGIWVSGLPEVAHIIVMGQEFVEPGHQVGVSLREKTV